MPRYYCDYCDTYLTHDSPSVRKQHNNGYKHKANVRTYYQQFEEQQTQSLIDQRIKEHLGQAAAFQQQVGATFHQHLALNPQRPRLPVPIMPMPPTAQLPGIRPPVFPRPPTGPPGYAVPPIMSPLMRPPGAPNMPPQLNGMPMPPTMGAPTTNIGATATTPTSSTVYQSGPTGVASDGFNNPAASGAPAASQDGFMYGQKLETNQ